MRGGGYFNTCIYLWACKSEDGFVKSNFVLILSAVHGKVVLCSISASCSCKLHLWKQYSYFLCFCCLLIYLRNFHGNVCGRWRGFRANTHQTDLTGCPLSQVGVWNQSNREGFKPVIWLHLLGRIPIRNETLKNLSPLPFFKMRLSGSLVWILRWNTWNLDYKSANYLSNCIAYAGQNTSTP